MVGPILRDSRAAKAVDLGWRIRRIVRGHCGAEGPEGAAIEAFGTCPRVARSYGVFVVESFAASLDQDGDAVRAGFRFPAAAGRLRGRPTALRC